jgi:prepilin-type N-terminal cleavage/methylation domain-containing protein
MKIHDKVTGDKWQVTRTGRAANPVTCHVSHVTCRAFTMVEIAICLAIIGIALVAIIGVLPIGVNVQKDNREETIINQDATVLIENIRNGARGADDLTNYVYMVTNIVQQFNNLGPVGIPNRYGYTYTGSMLNDVLMAPLFPITNGFRIIGLLSTPEYVDGSGRPIPNLSYANPSYSNHIVAYVRSISGSASEKPPQDNPIVTSDSFSYKIICENVPVATDTNAPSLYAKNLTANLHELRLTFLWPLLPNGKMGSGRQTFRTTVAGQIVQTKDISVTPNQMLYFFQPQSFTNAP